MSQYTVSSAKASVALSDHFFIECNLNIPRASSTIKESVYRKLKTLDLHVFKLILQNLCFVLPHGITFLSWPCAMKIP